MDNLNIAADRVDIAIDTLLKQSRPGRVGIALTFKAYPTDKRLCIVHYLKHVHRTQELRGTERCLFLTYKKPHHRATKQTISRWIKVTLGQAGIDTNKFSAHSTRAASTSSAKRHDIPLSTILKQAGWQGERTFQEIYLKPLEEDSFPQAILNQ